MQPERIDDRLTEPDAGPRCEWCNGTGYVTCFRESLTGEPTPVRFYEAFTFRYDHPHMIETSAPCNCADSPMQKRLAKASSDFPEGSRGFTLDNFKEPRYAQAVGLCCQLIDGNLVQAVSGLERSGVFLHGPVGTGKTTLAAVIMLMRIEAGETSARFIDFTTFIKQLQATYDDHYEGPNYQSIMQAAQTVHFLVLDDIGRLKPDGKIAEASEDRIDIMEQLIRWREGHKLPTIITANLSTAALYKHFGGRISSRAEGLCHPCKIDGADYRTTKEE